MITDSCASKLISELAEERSDTDCFMLS